LAIMKFRFTGGRDCPDWVLSEVFALSKLTSIKTKMLSTYILQTHLGQSLAGPKDLDMNKLLRLTSDAKFGADDVKAASAALTFILFSSAKHDCQPSEVTSELQQLGLPKEHSLALGKVLADFKQQLIQHLKESSLVIGGPKPTITDWKIQQADSPSIVAEPNHQSNKSLALTLSIETRKTWAHPGQNKDVTLTPTQMRVLLENLRSAKEVMGELSA